MIRLEGGILYVREGKVRKLGLGLGELSCYGAESYFLLFSVLISHFLTDSPLEPASGVNTHDFTFIFLHLYTGTYQQTIEWAKLNFTHSLSVMTNVYLRR